jgi:flavin-dependent thymidylate synthase
LTVIQLRSDMDVELIKSSAADSDILWAARVSTIGELSRDVAGPLMPGLGKADAGLINFLMKHRHGTPFEHSTMTFYVSAPIFVFREFQRHRIACLPGDIQITCESGRNKDGTVRTVYKRTIKEIYEAWHWNEMPTKKGWPAYRSRNRGIRVLNENTGLYETGFIKDVWKAGEKEVFSIRTNDGKEIRASADHLFLTKNGWMKMNELHPGIKLITSQNVSITPAGAQVPPSLRRGIGVWTSMQRTALIGEGSECAKCKDWFEASDLVLDHIIPVVVDLQKALDIKNLQILCKECHRSKTNVEQILAHRNQRLGKKLVSIVAGPVSVGTEMTYDIEMKGTWENFVANGLVVHNSYNEESSRYTQLKPVFYVPDKERALVQEGKPGHYTFIPGTQQQYEDMHADIHNSCKNSYETYVNMLSNGIAREVARMVLPLTIYSSMYVTMNARGLMNFLSLRVKSDDSMFPSFPQREIEMVAEKIEAEWAKLMPVTHKSFVANGRVCP